MESKPYVQEDSYSVDEKTSRTKRRVPRQNDSRCKFATLMQQACKNRFNPNQAVR